MKHVAIYIRVSSNGQDTKSQEPDLTQWAKSQAAQVLWYKDKATGKNMDRPGWVKLESCNPQGAGFGRRGLAYRPARPHGKRAYRPV